MKKISICLLIFIYSILFNSCFTYGRPGSFFVNFVGRDLDNFVEFKKEGTVSIADMGYSIIYLRRGSIVMGPPEVPRRGNYLVTSLVLRKLSRESEEIILFERNHRNNPGKPVESVIADKDNQRLFFMVEENVNGYRTDFLFIFDLASFQILDKILILDRSKYQREDPWLSGAYISNIVFNKINGQILFQISFKLETVYYEGRDYILFDINTRRVREISQFSFHETLEFLGISSDPYSYKSQNVTKTLFSIFPYSNYLPANYKHKYNGVYINDSANNIRISNNTRTFLGNRPLWLNDGQYVIIGSYLFDTSGRLNGIKIADGDVLAIF